ncbi:MAG: group I truncated hemoglobin [Alphaproteobacteria bacterium]
MAQTIFERYGGFASVRKVVSAFYDKILDSETLSPYFANTNMRTLIDHQTQFISMVMGGPGTITDDVLRRVHAPLGISREHFNEMADLLTETLEDFDYESPDVEYVEREIQRREPLIVTRFD